MNDYNIGLARGCRETNSMEEYFYQEADNLSVEILHPL